MPTLSLDVKWNLVNITNLQPTSPETFRWHFKVKCTNCGETKDSWHYIVMEEHVEVGMMTHLWTQLTLSLLEVPGSRGTANLVEKCKLCQRINTLTVIEDSVRPYSIDKNEQFQSILRLDCRGIEPFDFDPRSDWRGEGPESGTPFEDIDLNEKEWSDYDEKIQEAVEINSFSCRFSHSR